jgi:hypothetical protein
MFRDAPFSGRNDRDTLRKLNHRITAAEFECEIHGIWVDQASQGTKTAAQLGSAAYEMQGHLASVRPESVFP